jgi:hypothetical protein
MNESSKLFDPVRAQTPTTEVAELAGASLAMALKPPPGAKVNTVLKTVGLPGNVRLRSHVPTGEAIGCRAETAMVSEFWLLGIGSGAALAFWQRTKGSPRQKERIVLLFLSLKTRCCIVVNLLTQNKYLTSLRQNKMGSVQFMSNNVLDDDLPLNFPTNLDITAERFYEINPGENIGTFTCKDSLNSFSDSSGSRCFVTFFFVQIFGVQTAHSRNVQSQIVHASLQ